MGTVGRAHPYRLSRPKPQGRLVSGRQRGGGTETDGAEDVLHFAAGAPPTNLVAGTCRFGADPATSVLGRDCRAHEVENLFVTGGSFMPTGGSVPYTWTIYANAFRVADRIVAQLGGPKRVGDGTGREPV